MKSIAIALLSLLLIACVNTPTQTTETVDDRPRITFDTTAIKGALRHYDVVIDGLNYGSLRQYQAERSALRIVPGRHIVEIQRRGEVIFTKDVFLGENTTRTIKVHPQ